MSTADHVDASKRDFLYIATGAVGAVGTALTVWPLISQMNPDASVKALASTELDLDTNRRRSSHYHQMARKPRVHSSSHRG